jgi:hypothetical protein
MSAVPGMVPRKNSPGPGATGTGGGRDTPGAGKDRSEFEKDRQGRGTGKDRPPAYTPNDDGERGGYTNRSKPISPIPAPKIPSRTPLGPAGRTIAGSSAVHGMLPRY